MDSDCLYNVWFHSYEEDTEDIVVYRTRDFKFPPSRGREGFEIKASGEFIKYSIAPTDGLRPIGGRVRIEKSKLIIDFSEQPSKPYTLNIVSCDKGLLKIAKTK